MVTRNDPYFFNEKTAGYNFVAYFSYIDLIYASNI